MARICKLLSSGLKLNEGDVPDYYTQVLFDCLFLFSSKKKVLPLVKGVGLAIRQYALHCASEMDGTQDDELDDSRSDVFESLRSMWKVILVVLLCFFDLFF